MIPGSERWWIIPLVLLRHANLAYSAFGEPFMDRRNIQRKPRIAFPNDHTVELDGSVSIIRVAHVGNSIQSYGDTPRMLEQMLQTRFSIVVQDSMLRPGGTFKSMFLDGNNLEVRVNITAATLPDGTEDLGAPDVTTLFHEHNWDFIILNDRTTNAAQEEDREDSLSWLESSYAPIFPSNAKAVFLQTAADRIEDNRESTIGFGDFDEFTSRTREGYEAYVDLFESLSIPAIIAPIGDAYADVRETLGESMFDMLYSPDNIHPTPHGTWLQCCLLYCTMIAEKPPQYNSTWWSTARYLEGRDDESIDQYIPFPTDAEAEDLRQIAIDMCDL
jgi:hypothetical protein